jgi:hypothetical protein
MAKTKAGLLTRKDCTGAVLIRRHAAKVPLTILLLVAHACWVICAGTACKAIREAVVLMRKRRISY